MEKLLPSRKTMKQTTPNLEYYGQYPEIFRSQVHQMIAWGYEDALPQIRAANKKGRQETAITGFIVAAIKNRIRAINRPGWLRYYSAHDDPPVEAERKTGRSRPRVDIIIEGSGLKGSPEYLFEAKRLRRPGYGESKYIGEEGMGCFIQGPYGGRYDEAAMLGYFQSDSVEYWQQKIKKRIDHEAKNLSLLNPQSVVPQLNAFPFEWVSEHERHNIGRPIRIFHILLDCCLE